MILLDIVDDILTVVGNDKNGHHLNEEDIDLDRVIWHAISKAESLADERGVSLTLSPGTDSIGIYADPAALSQVFDHLIANAIKFTDPGGEVSIDVETPVGEGLQVIVRDTGIGIPASQQELVFQPFVKAERSSTRNLNGLGLGLSIAKTLTELHEGSIRLESKLGKGTAVTVYLPEPRLRP